LGHYDIKLGYAIGGVCGEGYIQAVIAVKPFWVMIHLLGEQGYAGHKAPALRKAFEPKALLERFSVF
jgi:hypothetical protein